MECPIQVRVAMQLVYYVLDTLNVEGNAVVLPTEVHEPFKAACRVLTAFLETAQPIIAK